jgi:cell cycle sensor histidine kinase DivJ
VSVISVNWKAIEKTFRTLCRRWVNPAITDEAEASLQGRLFALLFALPPLTLVTTLLAMAQGTSQNSALVALAISLPVLASSWLSLSASAHVRNLIIVGCGPMLVLATHASGAAMVIAASIAFVFGVLRAWQGLANWKIWQASGLAAMIAAVSTLLATPAQVGPLSTFAALPVILLAAYFTGWRFGYAPDTAATASLTLGNSELFALAAHAGSIMTYVERSGVVAKSEGRSTAEWLAPADLEGRGLVDKLHVADRPGFLAWIGGLTSNKAADVFKARLLNPTAHNTGLWVGAKFRRIREDSAGVLLSLVLENREDLNGNDTQAVAVGSLGHELRTPLNAIAGFSEMLRNGYCGQLANEKQAEYLDLIHRSSCHLLQVADAMLDWSQLESQTRQLQSELFLPADVAGLAIGIVSADAHAKRIGLDYNPACGFDEFRGDKRALTQILVNLLSNAIKFVPECGQVSLSIDIDEDCLKLSVRDNGPGMNADDQARIGTPFLHSRSLGSAAGNGLGLSIVRQLAKLHGGSMQVESVSGEGTCVTVALPELRAARPNISELRPALQDESTRIIQIVEEQGHAKNRKTA